MPWLHDVQGVLESWYPGQTYGTAIAAVLFGDASPGGRLPVTFPANANQGPAPASQPNHYPGVNGVEQYDEGLDVGYRWYDVTGQRPLFPFGYGLSYERFDVSGMRAFFNSFRGGATVIARVRNASDRPGLTPVRAVPRVARSGPGAAQAAQGLHRRRARPRPEQVRPVPPEPERPRLLQHQRGQVHGRPRPLHRARRDIVD